MNRTPSTGEPLSQADVQAVNRLLALAPTSPQLIAALHETYVREGSAQARPSEPISAEPTRPIACDTTGVGATDNPQSPEPTLNERARRIDPRTGGVCRAFWGEWISPHQRAVGRALCWYPLPDRVDLVPDWAMREAWPECAQIWEELLQSGWDRH